MRVKTVRENIPEEIKILVDANTNYSLQDVQKAMPFYEENEVFGKEPFPAMEFNNYKVARSLKSIYCSRRKSFHKI